MLDVLLVVPLLVGVVAVAQMVVWRALLAGAAWVVSREFGKQGAWAETLGGALRPVVAQVEAAVGGNLKTPKVNTTDLLLFAVVAALIVVATAVQRSAAATRSLERALAKQAKRE
jgi:hypothetical protein